MTQKPTGVFVRLPLSDDQKRLAVAEMMFAGIPVADAFVSALLAIGTPVTGGELEVVGYITDNRPFDTNTLTHWILYKQRQHAREYGVVLQSDALAKLAEKDAEIGRLREALESLENANNNLCFMRSNDTYQSMMRDGCGDLLAKLDDARRAAREALKGGAA